MNTHSSRKNHTLAKVVFGFLAALFAALIVWLLLPSAASKPDSTQAAASREDPEAVQLEDPLKEAEHAQDSPKPLPKEGEEVNPLVLDGLSFDPAFIQQLDIIVSSPVQNFPRRHAAIQALSNNLSEPEIRALSSFLLSHPPEDEAERVHDRVIKNDLLNRLREQNTQPVGLAALMIAMFEDTEQDDAVRDYALQQMRAWHDQVPLEERPVLLGSLSEALKETKGSMAGTALLALRELEKAEGTEKWTEVTEAAIAMINDEAASDLSRITAMQVVVEERPEEILSLAAEWASDPGASYPRRLTGIAALGKAGTPEAALILVRVDSGDDPYLLPALQTAYRSIREAGIELEKIESR